MRSEVVLVKSPKNEREGGVVGARRTQQSVVFVSPSHLELIDSVQLIGWSKSGGEFGWKLLPTPVTKYLWCNATGQMVR